MIPFFSMFTLYLKRFFLPSIAALVLLAGVFFFRNEVARVFGLGGQLFSKSAPSQQSSEPRVKMSNTAPDLFHSLISFNVDKGTIKVKENCFNSHNNPSLKMHGRVIFFYVRMKPNDYVQCAKD